MARDMISDFGPTCSMAIKFLLQPPHAESTELGRVKLTGQVPPLIILSNDSASGMPYGQLELEVTESRAELFSDWKDEREEST